MKIFILPLLLLSLTLAPGQTRAAVFGNESSYFGELKSNTNNATLIRAISTNLMNVLSNDGRFMTGVVAAAMSSGSFTNMILIGGGGSSNKLTNAHLTFGGGISNSFTNATLVNPVFTNAVLNGYITNNATNYGGIYSNAVLQGIATNSGTVFSGVYSNPSLTGLITNGGTAIGGNYSNAVLQGSITNTGTVYGGTYGGTITNNATNVGGTHSPTAFFFQKSPLYISPTGSDSAAGTLAAPVATLSRAVTMAASNTIGGSTFLFRAGNYTNDTASLNNLSGSVVIANYSNEVVNLFFGETLSVFTNYTGSVFRATASLDAIFLATNVYDYTEDGRNGYGDRYAFEQGTPFGTNAILPLQRIYGGLTGNLTNRITDYPLILSINTNSMTAGTWAVTNGEVFVRFVDGTSNHTLRIPSSTRTWLSGGNGGTDLRVSGLRIYYPRNGLNLSGLRSAEIDGVYVQGAALTGFWCEGAITNTSQPRLLIRNSEAAACSGFGFSYDGNSASGSGEYVPTVTEMSCWWHDNGREGSSVRGNTRRFVIGSKASHNRYGFIGADNNALSHFIGVTTYSNEHGFQIGTGVGARFTNHFTVIEIENSYSIRDTEAFTIDGPNNYLVIKNHTFDYTTNQIPVKFVSNTPGDSNYVWLAGSDWRIIDSGINQTTIIQGPFIAANVTYTNTFEVGGLYGLPKALINSNGLNIIGSIADIHFNNQGQIGVHTDNVWFGYQSTPSPGNGNAPFENSGYNAIIGGRLNRMTNSPQRSIIAGGYNNVISGSGFYQNILGGVSNSVSGVGDALIVGGSGNTSTGVRSMVLHGIANSATADFAVASGSAVTVSHSGSWMINDGMLTTSSSSGASNSFLLQFAGGYGFGTNNPGGGFTVATNASFSSSVSVSNGLFSSNYTFFVSTNSSVSPSVTLSLTNRDAFLLILTNNCTVFLTNWAASANNSKRQTVSLLVSNPVAYTLSFIATNAGATTNIIKWADKATATPQPATNSYNLYVFDIWGSNILAVARTNF